jgi:hypothetical protein
MLITFEVIEMAAEKLRHIPLNSCDICDLIFLHFVLVTIHIL